MGLFSKKKESPEELAFKEENRRKLENFVVTKAWGIKKYRPAMQFIYDGNARQFVVVEGPEETFRERNPYIIDFDDVTDVVLEVEETWSKSGGEYDPAGYGTLLQDDYKNVFWRYEFYLTIKTRHPYAGDIRYRMNFKPTITKIPDKGIFYRRGFGIGGKYKGKEIPELIDRLEELLVDEANLIKAGNVLDIVMLRKKDQSIAEGVFEKVGEDIYLKKIVNMTDHVRRAERIRKLLLG
ncbi:MAG: hypothetical protein IJH92_07275 [Mogibacterium sp.]|nr:hypothetical protein [Mogibacterium sp.]